MKTEEIGTYAGLVWQALENGELELKDLRKATKLTAQNLNFALGWLAREGKVSLREEAKDLFISLA